MTLPVILIAAMTPERVIGKDNGLPWPRKLMRQDMKLFSETTTGNTVIMGRSTYESLPSKFQPLPDRRNIVVSRTMEQGTFTQNEREYHVCNSLDSALETAQQYGHDIFVIGGAQIYEAALPKATHMYLSHTKDSFEGDTLFPEFNAADWKEVERVPYDAFEFVRYERN